MHTHNLVDQVNALRKAGMLKPGVKVDEAVALLQAKCWTDRIADVWGIEDVLEHAKSIRVKLTKAQAREVLQAVLEDHDATVGINWDVIEDYIRRDVIEDYIRRR